MGQDLGVQTHRNTLYALRQQQRELHRQMDRLVLAAVIGFHPLGGLGIEGRLQGEFGEARLYITRCGGSVTGKYIPPVTLAVNEQVFLAQLDQRVADRGITVRVILHSLTDDVRHLVVLAVIHGFHRVEDTALHRLQTILNRRHGTLQYHIRGIVQEPVLVHTRQVILHSIIESTLTRHASVRPFY